MRLCGLGGLLGTSSTYSLCPNPTLPNKVLGVEILTKCGVVVGVFGLGPKGRGLDSLHLWVPPTKLNL